jgi:hypothetical protein
LALSPTSRRKISHCGLGATDPQVGIEPFADFQHVRENSRLDFNKLQNVRDFVFHTVSGLKMAARAGIETASEILQAVLGVITCESEPEECAQHGAQKLGDLAEIMREWTKLSPEIKFSIMALVRARNPV